MKEIFSENILYEPILRILNGQGYNVKCEHECPGIKHPLKGDKKRLDFYAVKDDLKIALEVKWIKNKKLIFQEILRN